MNFVRAVLNTILDAIVPRKGRTVRIEDLRIEDLLLSPSEHDVLGTRITTLMHYRDQSAQDLIKSLKYDGGGRAAHMLAAIVAEYLTEEIANQKTFSSKTIRIIPIPLHETRVRERGFNQIEAVLDRLPGEFRSLVQKDILVRSRPTPQQTRLSRSERLSNVAGAFALQDDADLRKTHVYLIDDVTTTGATLANAATPLRRAGATVSLIALARA